MPTDPHIDILAVLRDTRTAVAYAKARILDTLLADLEDLARQWAETPAPHRDAPTLTPALDADEARAVIQAPEPIAPEPAPAPEPIAPRKPAPRAKVAPAPDAAPAPSRVRAPKAAIVADTPALITASEHTLAPEPLTLAEVDGDGPF